MSGFFRAALGGSAAPPPSRRAGSVGAPVARAGLRAVRPWRPSATTSDGCPPVRRGWGRGST
jgi:hypothetical protein